MDPVLDQRYAYVRKIGKGSYGTVHMIQDRHDGSHWCLKVVKNTPIDMDKSAELNDALREVQLMQRLSHPNIVSLREAMQSSDERNIYIIIAYCDSGDMDQRISQAREAGVAFSEQQVMDWFIQMLLALTYLHSQHVLHRDIKPQNVFLSKSNTLVKIGDFGLTRMLDSTDALAKTMIGTPYYMSPELCSHKPYSYKSDVWALGCVLYQLLTLRLPFPAKDFGQLRRRILKREPEPITSAYSAELRQLVAEMFTKDPQLRPSAQQLLAHPYVQSHMQHFVSRHASALKRASPSRRSGSRSSRPGSASHTPSSSRSGTPLAAAARSDRSMNGGVGTPDGSAAVGGGDRAASRLSVGGASNSSAVRAVAAAVVARDVGGDADAPPSGSPSDDYPDSAAAAGAGAPPPPSADADAGDTAELAADSPADRSALAQSVRLVASSVSGRSSHASGSGGVVPGPRERRAETKEEAAAAPAATRTTTTTNSAGDDDDDGYVGEYKSSLAGAAPPPPPPPPPPPRPQQLQRQSSRGPAPAPAPALAVSGKRASSLLIDVIASPGDASSPHPLSSRGRAVAAGSLWNADGDGSGENGAGRDVATRAAAGAARSQQASQLTPQQLQRMLPESKLDEPPAARPGVAGAPAAGGSARLVVPDAFPLDVGPSAGGSDAAVARSQRGGGPTAGLAQGRGGAEPSRPVESGQGGEGAPLGQEPDASASARRHLVQRRPSSRRLRPQDALEAGGDAGGDRRDGRPPSRRAGGASGALDDLDGGARRADVAAAGSGAAPHAASEDQHAAAVALATARVRARGVSPVAPSARARQLMRQGSGLSTDGEGAARSGAARRGSGSGGAVAITPLKASASGARASVGGTAELPASRPGSSAAAAAAATSHLTREQLLLPQEGGAATGLGVSSVLRAAREEAASGAAAGSGYGADRRRVMSAIPGYRPAIVVAERTALGDGGGAVVPPLPDAPATSRLRAVAETRGAALGVDRFELLRAQAQQQQLRSRPGTAPTALPRQLVPLRGPLGDGGGLVVRGIGK